MSSDRIRQHPLFPFADFRTSDASFQMLEVYWAAAVREALGEALAAQMVPLMAMDRDTECRGDAVTVGWGNPVMVDFWRPDQRRGVRVMLLENTEGLPACRDSSDKMNCSLSIIVYMQRRGVTGPDDEIDQICFCADMSEVARDVVVQLMKAFMVQGIPADEVEPWYDAFCVRTGEGPSREELQAYYASLDREDDAP